MHSCRSRGRRQSSSQTSTPFPWRQLSVLALCRLCEPVAFMSVFPYIYFMIKSFGYTDVKYISIYASLVTSAFAFAEFSSGMFWGRMSDRIGRKPVLLMGMFGTGLSMLAFGFSRNLPLALLARALGGLLNGNIGVLQTTVAEVVTVESHQPRAFSIMPFVWCIGSIIGSSLGGLLSQPVANYPRFFSVGSVWERFPFLLPNLVCVAFVFFGLTVGLLFLEETHEDYRARSDWGLQIGQRLLTLIGKSENGLDWTEKTQITEETTTFLPKGPNTRRHRSTSSLDVECLKKQLGDLSGAEKKTLSVRDAFTPQITLLICAVGILAFHTISFEQQLPILMAYDEQSSRLTSAFKFLAGFGMNLKTIGGILAIQGVFQMIAQLIIFPMVVARLNALWTFRLVIFSYPVLYVITPYLALLPSRLRMPGVYLIIIWKVLAQAMSYPSAAIMLTNATPSRKVLGTVNGVYSSSASLCRAIGPIISGLIQAYGTSKGYSVFAWWACALVSLIGAIECIWMKGERSEKTNPAMDEETADCQLNDSPITSPTDDSFTTLALLDSDEDTAAEESDAEDDGTLCNTPRDSSIDLDFQHARNAPVALPKDT